MMSPSVTSVSPVFVTLIAGAEHAVVPRASLSRLPQDVSTLPVTSHATGPAVQAGILVVKQNGAVEPFEGRLTVWVWSPNLTVTVCAFATQLVALPQICTSLPTQALA